MSPVIHTLLQLALFVLGGAAGGWLGAVFHDRGGEKSIGPHVSLPSFGGAVAGFFVVFSLWNRFVPLRCPVCNGKMTKVYGQGRHLVFRCSSCERSQ